MSDWSPVRRLGAYAAALAVVFAASLGLGRLGPEVDDGSEEHETPHAEATTSTTIVVTGFGHDHRSHSGATTTVVAP